LTLQGDLIVGQGHPSARKAAARSALQPRIVAFTRSPPVARARFAAAPRRLAAGSATIVATAASARRNPPRIVAVVTEYRKHSHAQNIVDRFLDGLGWESAHRRPRAEVVSLYVDQIRDSDLSGERIQRFPSRRRRCSA
jgi:hypothetical protein